MLPKAAGKALKAPPIKPKAKASPAKPTTPPVKPKTKLKGLG